MNKARPLQKFVGAGLMVVGGLIAALCGTCSGLVLYPTRGGLTSDDGAAGALAMLVIVAIIGGIPTMFGLWVANRGWRGLQAAGKTLRPDKTPVGDDPDRGSPS